MSTHRPPRPGAHHRQAPRRRGQGAPCFSSFNRRYGRTGTLWEGRFKSCLVDSARYVLGCHRYIERNPVEAGMVATPAAYTWSSHCGNIGLAHNKLLTPHVEYLALASEQASRN